MSQHHALAAEAITVLVQARVVEREVEARLVEAALANEEVGALRADDELLRPTRVTRVEDLASKATAKTLDRRPRSAL